MKIILIKSKKLGTKECLVDDEDFEYLNHWKWKILSHKTSFYAARSTRKGTILMHRSILKLTDSSILCDHDDHNGLNNQKYNLRTCTKAQNNRNVKSRLGSTSNYLGVSWDKVNSKWLSQITFENKVINLGRFKSEIQAAEAYNTKAVELFGEFANPNSI